MRLVFCRSPYRHQSFFGEASTNSTGEKEPAPPIVTDTLRTKLFTALSEIDPVATRTQVSVVAPPREERGAKLSRSVILAIHPET